VAEGQDRMAFGAIEVVAVELQAPDAPRHRSTAQLRGHGPADTAALLQALGIASA
jgi:hypothetical protein